jgi:hypothetical protein
MSIATLADIITKVRRLTGSGNSFQLTDSQIKDYINSFYLYDFPAQFRSLKLKDIYKFDTTRGIDTYAFDSERYTTIQAPCWVAKRETNLYFDPTGFYAINFDATNSRWQQIEIFATGNGTIGPYTGMTQGTPLVRSVNTIPTNLNYPASRVQNILITANSSLGSTQNVIDDGSGTTIGNLIDPVTGANRGTINYETGAISVTFANTVPAGEQIVIEYRAAVLNIPLGVLFFQNQFTLRPIPDRGYTVEVVAYRQPTQALEDTPGDAGTPELNEWWEAIAAGAAKKVYEDRLDSDGLALMDKLLFERYKVVETRTYAQMGKSRVSTIYADQLSYTYNSNSTAGLISGF